MMIAAQYLVGRWQRNPVRLALRAAGVASSTLILRGRPPQSRLRRPWPVSRPWQRNPVRLGLRAAGVASITFILR
eukprot:6374254-Amphidinium_carterae.1